MAFIIYRVSPARQGKNYYEPGRAKGLQPYISEKCGIIPHFSDLDYKMSEMRDSTRNLRLKL